MRNLVIGVDFGSDSVRSVILDAANGNTLSVSDCEYARWMEGKYCDPAKNIFRQHPKDYLEAFENCVKGALMQLEAKDIQSIRALSIDTTGSTPAPVNSEGVPLAMLPEFAENPDAMFYMWKDHSAIEEAKVLNTAFSTYGDEDYTRFQGAYSSEWYWAKILHAYHTAPDVCEAAASWVEHSDWIPAMLTGQTDPSTMYRNACAAGHKALWHSDFGGLPPRSVLEKADPYLAKIADGYGAPPKTSNTKVGTITHTWADKLGLPRDVIIGGSSFDAHAGAVGAGIKPKILVKVVGTSTVDMMVETRDMLRGKDVRDICGQAENSIIPEYVGIESGQAAFGDMMSWFRRILMWSVKDFLLCQDNLTDAQKKKLEKDYYSKVLSRIEKEASTIVPDMDLVALDWFNGRRYPMINESVKSVLAGLTLGTTIPQVYAALSMAAVFGSRRIFDIFITRGIQVDAVITVGGIAKKSPYIMQMMADVLKRPIMVSKSEQCSATGAAIYAAASAGIYKNILEAVEHMSEGFECTYQPQPDKTEMYDSLFKKYLILARHEEVMQMEYERKQ